jgi:hypothetical protein
MVPLSISSRNVITNVISRYLYACKYLSIRYWKKYKVSRYQRCNQKSDPPAPQKQGLSQTPLPSKTRTDNAKAKRNMTKNLLNVIIQTASLWVAYELWKITVYAVGILIRAWNIYNDVLSSNRENTCIWRVIEYMYMKSERIHVYEEWGYARASSNYSDFLKRHLHLRNRLLDQGY